MDLHFFILFDEAVQKEDRKLFLMIFIQGTFMWNVFNSSNTFLWNVFIFGYKMNIIRI